MTDLLWLIPALPFGGFISLIILGRRMSRRFIALVGAGSVGLSACLTTVIGVCFISDPPDGYALSQILWRWIEVGNFAPNISFRLDALSLLMALVVTFVGFLIHVYSTEFMEGEEGYSRFFAYMNLFVGFMLILVLADDLLLLYLGWEGVGLCSYLLIGFWYKDANNGYAARKAFVVTRIGDTAMAIGLFLLFTNIGTLQIQDVLHRAGSHWPVGSTLAIAAAALLFAGAIGKSAQIPLQIWLPDAMAGPTPVSALIHAATMVTAGVYLIARMHTLFELAPQVQALMAVTGAATLLISATSALAQRDIKRVLAYSTISQIGYMFLALGVGAWSAAMFHFMTHAFFKALLFLAAGTVILSLHHEHDMFRMGGLRKAIPVTFFAFLVGSASLSALPVVTAGFYSKELILWQVWSSGSGSVWLWAVGAVGAFLTSIYTFRMVFLVFYGEPKTGLSRPGMRIHIPLIVLAILSVIAGFLETPETLGGLKLFTSFIGTVLPVRIIEHTTEEFVLQATVSIISLAGVFVSYLLYLKKPLAIDALMRFFFLRLLHKFWLSGWGFDTIYDRLFVRPFNRLARVNSRDFMDSIYTGTARLVKFTHRAAGLTQTGKVRWYAFGIGIGAAILIWMAL